MANRDHLRVLDEGIDKWNQWRRNNPAVSPDLSNSRLDERLLAAIDFSRTDLSGASLAFCDLSRANLDRASLRVADLSGTSLHGANLQNASLVGARLVHATLLEADLRNADLALAYIRNSDFQRANLDGVRFLQTCLIKVDLAEARGLNSCRHRSPSAIDPTTLENNPHLPSAFYGQGKSIKPLTVFISHSSEDRGFIRQLVQDIERQAVDCSPDPEPWTRLKPTLERKIRACGKFLLVLSSSALESDWVQWEYEIARDEERVRMEHMIVPIRIDDSVIRGSVPWVSELSKMNIPKFGRTPASRAYKQGLSSLISELKGVIS
jgi:hypothetical protein